MATCLQLLLAYLFKFLLINFNDTGSLNLATLDNAGQFDKIALGLFSRLQQFAGDLTAGIIKVEPLSGIRSGRRTVDRVTGFAAGSIQRTRLCVLFDLPGYVLAFFLDHGCTGPVHQIASPAFQLVCG